MVTDTLSLPQDILYARLIDGAREMAHPVEPLSTTYRVRWDILNKGTQWHIETMAENTPNKTALVAFCDNRRSSFIRALHYAAGISRRDKYGLKR